MRRRVATAKAGPAWPARPKRLVQQLEESVRWLSPEGEAQRQQIHIELDKLMSTPKRSR